MLSGTLLFYLEKKKEKLAGMVTREQKQKREQRTKQRKKPCRYQNSSPENSPADIKIVSRTEAATGGVL